MVKQIIIHPCKRMPWPLKRIKYIYMSWHRKISHIALQKSKWQNNVYSMITEVTSVNWCVPFQIVLIFTCM